jgi:hypothetical protein
MAALSHLAVQLERNGSWQRLIGIYHRVHVLHQSGACWRCLLLAATVNDGNAQLLLRKEMDGHPMHRGKRTHHGALHGLTRIPRHVAQLVHGEGAAPHNLQVIAHLATHVSRVEEAIGVDGACCSPIVAIHHRFRADENLR